MQSNMQPLAQNLYVETHPEVDWSEAPEWACFAGRDRRGWHWMNHRPTGFVGYGGPNGDLATGILTHPFKCSNAFGSQGHELAFTSRYPLTDWTKLVQGDIVRVLEDRRGNFEPGELAVVEGIEHPSYRGDLAVLVTSLDGERNEWIGSPNKPVEFVASSRELITVGGGEEAQTSAQSSPQAMPVPPPPPPLVPVTKQQAVLRDLNAIREAAEKYRETGERIGTFRPTWGICDNIAEVGTFGKTATVKDNLICRTPSFSGEHHYPVPGPEGCDASTAWDRYDEKWTGEYGDNRLKQLNELIHLVETEWHDNLISRRTPAERLGFVIGQPYVYKTDGSIWVFVRDDDSSDPMFRNTVTGEERWRPLSEMKPKPKPVKRSVKAFIRLAEKAEAKKAVAQAKLKELRQQIQELDAEIALLDEGLREQHKVKRA